MTTEHVLEADESTNVEVAPPPVVAETKPKNGAGAAGKTKEKDKDPDDADILGRATKETKPIRDLRNAEAMTIKQIVESLGQSGPFKITVKRLEPEEFRDPVSGRMVNTGGTLKSYEHEIDEDFVQARHGGGKYELIFKARGEKGGMQFVTSRQIKVGGDPRLDDVPRNVAPAPALGAAAAAAPATEAPSVVNKAMEMMERQLEHQRAATAPPPLDTATLTKPFEVIIRGLQEQIAAERASHTEVLSQMRTELAAARAYRAPEDPIKEKILNGLIDGESGRISALRITHESELRTVKANAIEDEKRLRDAFERDKASLVAAFDRERQTMIHSHEIAMGAAKASFDTQSKMLDGQIRTLERDNGELRTEVKELRLKKEKGIVETVKDMNAIKEALGMEEGGESSAMDTIAGIVTNPDALNFAKSIMGKPTPGGAQQQPAAATGGGRAQVAAGSGQTFERQIVKTPDGQQWIMEADGRLTGPVRRKGKGPASEPDIPVIPEDKIRIAVTFLERAVENGSEPETVATGARALVPDEIISVLRDHGPDVFMSKVAKIPSNSPLSSQEAKNWIRKFAKALVG